MPFLVARGHGRQVHAGHHKLRSTRLLDSQDAIGGDAFQLLNGAARPLYVDCGSRGLPSQSEMQPEVAGGHETDRAGHVVVNCAARGRGELNLGTDGITIGFAADEFQ